MVILKLRRPFLVETRFVPYEGAFTWIAQLEFAGYTQPTRYDSSFDFTQPALNEVTTDIGNVYVDNVKYALVASIALMQSTEKSYYWDIINQLLYVHVAHDKRLTASNFDSLEVRGYSSDDVFIDDNNITFLPYLNGNVTITDKADRLVYNKMSFINNNLQLDNLYGEFDDLGDDPTPGADANILYISRAEINAGSRTPAAKYTGYINADNLSLTGYNVQVKDKRAQYNVTIPSTYFDSTTYPNIEGKYIGNVIPEGYWNVIGAPATCTNGVVTTGNVNYKYATDGFSITTVYIKTDDAWNTVTPVSTDPTNGELVLSATDARDSSGNPKQCKVDARLRDIATPGNIIIDMIERYLGINYTSDNYDTSQWATETTGEDFIYFYMGEQCKFYECIEKIQGASDIGFKFYVNADNKFTIKKDRLTRAVSKAYTSINNISNITQSKRDFTQYATSVVIKYSKDLTDKTFSSVIVDTYEEDTFNKYRFYQQLEYESNLLSSADATAKGDNIALDYSEARNEISFDIEGIENIEIYDIITLDTSVYSRGVKTRDYLGTRKLKVSGIVWDFGNEKTTITGYDITDI